MMPVARWSPSSARVRIRSRETEVSAVSAPAAKEASTMVTARGIASQVMARSVRGRPAPIRRVSEADPAGGPEGCGRRSGLSYSSEQLADAPPLMDAHDRLCDQGGHRENPELRMVVEGPRLHVERDGVGDADLVDGRVVQTLQRTLRSEERRVGKE